MTSRRFLLSGLAGSALGLWAESGDTLAKEVSPNGNVQQISRKLRFTINITNPKAVALENQAVWMYLPARVATTHELIAVDVSTAHTVEYDVLGHSVLKIQWNSMPAFFQQVIRVNCDLRLRDLPSTQRPESPANWLKHERYIEVSDPQIQALAKKLKASTELKTAQSIYEWIASNLTYAGYIADDLGAQYALSERRGDCTEYAYLAVALARAVGIPARMVGGFVVDRDTAIKSDDYHNWAQLWVAGGWLVLDAQKQKWLDPKMEYITFRYFQNEPTNAVGTAHRYRIQGDFLVHL